MKNKIVHIIHHLSRGGRERRMAQLVNSMRSNSDFTIYIIVFDLQNSYLIDFPKDDIFLVNKSLSRWRMYQRFNELFRLLNPDIVHMWVDSFSVVLTVSILKKLLGFKLIAGSLADANPIKSLSDQLAAKIAFISANKVVSNSRAGLIAKSAPLKKSIVIYNGFDYNRLALVDFNEQLMRIEFGISNRRVVAMVARLTDSKDWPMFLKVASMFSERSDVVFLAVGDGCQRDELQILSPNNVIFTGRRNDVENIFKLAEVSLLFSNSHVHAEGVSNSILESMAVGVPVIATRGGGTSEIIDDKVNGFIIDPGAIDSAVEKIKMLLDNEPLRKQMGKNAIKEVEKKFLLSEMSKQYINLYLNLLHI